MKTCYTSLARINTYCFPFFYFQCGIILETEMQLQAANSHGTCPGINIQPEKPGGWWVVVWDGQ